jgi:ParB-like nuclease domain
MPKISVEAVVIDESLYPRNGVSDFNVTRLVHALNTGAKVPPIVIEARTKRLVGGRHRLEAHKKLGIEKIECVEKTYASEADFFADAVRDNIAHGEPLDSFAIKSAIVRLEQYGYTRDKISEVIRVPVVQIDKITRGFASDAGTGKPLALKGGLSHLAGQALDVDQQKVNRHYSGGKAVFYLRQLCDMLENNMWPNQSTAFAAEMDRLVGIWNEIKKAEAA